MSGLGKLIRSKTYTLVLKELGVEAKLRKPNVYNLILGSGTVPDYMQVVIASYLNGGKAQPAASGDSVTQAKGLLEVIEAVCKACFVEPRIVDLTEDLDDDSCLISDIPLADQMQVFAWAAGLEDGGQGDQAVKFLEEQRANLAALHPEQSVSD